MFDRIFRSGRIIDGSGGPSTTGDVGVRGDRITAIGDLSDAAAASVIDIRGKAIAPGFIDVHNHSDGWLLNTPHFRAKTAQGFTTEVLMSDGISYAPVNERTWREWFYYLRALNGLRLDEYRGWGGIEDYFTTLAGGTVQNVVAQIPYANLRSLACGFGPRRVDDFQMRQIQADVVAGMEQGAVGLSTGLDYMVQCFSTTDELCEAASAMSPHDGLYVTHVRYKKGLIPGIAEAVEIGRRADVKVHISHLKGQTEEHVQEVLGYIDKVRREVDISFDAYPYQPGSTMLNYLVPYEALEGGPLASLSRLVEPDILARFRRGLECQRLELDRIRIAWVGGKHNTTHQGKRLSEYVEHVGLPAEEALARLLIEEGLAVLLVFDEGDDALISPILQHDLYMMGSDGIFFEGGVVHPRAFGSAPRLLGRCVRDLKLFSLEAAVHKLSGRPAERFGLGQRGLIRENYFADLVVFDTDKIADKATYEQPAQLAEGVEHLMVNGVAVIEQGQPLAPESTTLPGRYLRYKSPD